MPGAPHQLAVTAELDDARIVRLDQRDDVALAKIGTFMRASIGNCEELTLDVEDRNVATLNMNQLRLAFGNLIHTRHNVARGLALWSPGCGHLHGAHFSSPNSLIALSRKIALFSAGVSGTLKA